MKQASASFKLLHPSVQRWVWQQGWTSLKDIQENAIPVVLRGDCDVIISAATAGGKTEAAFLPILTTILDEAQGEGFSVLYISPLKALINDQFRRLTEMTQGMNIDVVPWHGDVDAGRKKRALKSPNGILIITPESLESFLINRSEHIDDAFRNLKYVVIDEMHSFMGTERGKQVQSLLSRVEHTIHRLVPRIAMSATFSDYESAKHFLRNNQQFPCVVPSPGESNHETKILVKEYLCGKDIDEKPLITTEIYSKLRGSNNLVFANSRVAVEKYALMLTDKCKENGVPNEFRVHHGSLSKTEREQVEHELQKGLHPVTAVCTSTLELGVDIGKVKSIGQIGVANSVSALRQRLGRSGRRDEASILRVFSVDEKQEDILYYLRSQLVQNIAVIELLKEHRYENCDVNAFHYSTLIQQILSVIAQYGSFYPQDGWTLLCKDGAFNNVTAQDFLHLLKVLGEQEVISQLSNGQIIIGTNGEKIIKEQDFYTAFVTEKEFHVTETSSGRIVGTLPMSIVVSRLQVGNAIVLAGQRWMIKKIDCVSLNIHVQPTNVHGETVFGGFGSDVFAMIVQKMKEVYSSDEQFAYLDTNTRADEHLQLARLYFAEHKLATTSFLTIGDKCHLCTWAGSIINSTIALMAENITGRQFGCNHISVFGVDQQLVTEILHANKPTSRQLCKLLKREFKESQKYDNLLPDTLLDKEFAKTYLDVDGAWEVLRTINEQSHE